jgi:hypothetical protein
MNMRFVRHAGLALAGLVLLVAATAGVLANAGFGGPAQPSFDRVSSPGTPTMLPAADLLLARARTNGQATGEQRLLAIRGTEAFYRIRSSSERECYGIASSGSPALRLEALQCSRSFPSREYPVLPFVTLMGSPDSDQLRVTQSDGIAADGVTAVAFETSDGRYVSRTEVQDNVYQMTGIPKEGLVALAAFDAAGDVVYRQSLP